MGQHPPGLSFGDVGKEHPSHSVVVHCSQAVLGNGENHHLRIAVEVLEEGSLQSEVECGEGMLNPHYLGECLEGQ